VDEFQRYCSLLTDRIQKMEEQNVELVKLAEQQKTEYEKVNDMLKIRYEHSSAGTQLENIPRRGKRTFWGQYTKYNKYITIQKTLGGKITASGRGQT